jgi:zinc finger protein
MCTISVPYFKDIVVMSFLCPHCGAKETELKCGGEITPTGKIITLNVESVEDLKRDLFKSETAGLKIPELELELSSGTLGGVYTTVEGIL